jgi:hypothetical protein
VALSTVQAELTALTAQSQDIQLVQDMFRWLDIEFPKTTVVMSDNRGAIQNAKHPCFSQRLRHVDNKIFYIREVVMKKLVSLLWISGQINPANLGTKPLGGVKHQMYSEFLMNSNLPFRKSVRYVKRIANISKIIKDNFLK